jgi:hypothetical protein
MFHELSAVAQLLMRLSFGFSLGVGVLTNIFIPHPKREAKRESHSYENLTWLHVRGGGLKKNILSSLLTQTNKHAHSPNIENKLGLSCAKLSSSCAG